MRISAGMVVASVAAAAALAPANASAAPKVTLSVARAAPVAVGRSAKVTVTVAARGRGSVRGLRLSLAPAKGVSAKVTGARRGRLSRALPSIARRRPARVTITLTPSARAAARTRSTIAVRRAGRLLARRTVTLVVRRAAPSPSPAPAPAPAPTPAGPANPLVGRYFYRTYLVGAGMYYDTYYFANGTATGGFAYHGRPAGGLPDCPAATAQGDGDGCIPYTYDPATGAVGADGKTGSLTAPHVLRLGAGVFGEAITPAAGMALDVYVHALSGSGTCGISCTFVARQVKFAPDGQFARSTEITGSTPESAFAALPPDQHGTYAVQAGGRIQFTYASGQVVVETIGLMLDDADQPNPAYGILLDGTIYWGPVSGV